MQISRIMKLLFILLEQRKVTARQLAEMLEVSTRTIYRDIDVLSAAGIPVYTLEGRNGGIALLEHYVLDKSMLSNEEQNQIILALQNISAAGYESDASQTLSKVSSLFQKNEEKWMEVDYSRWGYEQADKDKFEQLKYAILNYNVITFQYVDRNGIFSERQIEPVKLIYKSKSWYLKGYCLQREAYRVFKLNRISKITLEKKVFAKREACPEAEAASGPSCQEVILKFRKGAVFRVYEEFAPEDITVCEDGTLTVTTQMPVDNWMVGYLLSFGSEVKIQQPEDLQKQVYHAAKQVYEQYASLTSDEKSIKI